MKKIYFLLHGGTNKKNNDFIAHYTGLNAAKSYIPIGTTYRAIYNSSNGAKDSRLYKYQHANALTRPTFAVSRRDREAYDDKNIINAYCYNPYYNVNEFGIPVLQGTAIGTTGDAGPYGLAIDPDNQWFEEYDADGNLVDWDYGQGLTEELSKEMYRRLDEQNNIDFAERHEDLGDGRYRLVRNMPLLIPLAWEREVYKDWGKENDLFESHNTRKINTEPPKGKKVASLDCREGDEMSGKKRRR